MKTLSKFFLVVLTLLPLLSHAQFGEGSMFLGPHIGLSAYESSPTFGANFEFAVNKPGELGDGLLGVSARVDYTSFDWGSGYSWSLLSIGAYCNYHFKVGADGKFDPFLGLGLGFHNWSHNYDGPEGGDTFADNWNSGVYFAANAGARYFLSKALALRAQVGFGVTFFVFGVDFGI